MKEKLIKLAKEKGFKSELIQLSRYTIVEHSRQIGKKFLKEKLDYLFLCELQKWLRDNYKIYLNIDFYHDGHPENLNLQWDYTIESDTGKACFEIHNIEESFNIYEQALEKGLYEALKLIN